MLLHLCDVGDAEDVVQTCDHIAEFIGPESRQIEYKAGGDFVAHDKEQQYHHERAGLAGAVTELVDNVNQSVKHGGCVCCTGRGTLQTQAIAR